MRNKILVLVISLIIALPFCKSQQNLLSIIEKMESGEQPELPDSIFNMVEQLNRPEGYLLVAYLLYQDGEYSACIESCEKAIALRPLSFSNILLRGLARHQLGFRQSAWQDIMLVLDPEACHPGVLFQPDRESEAALLAAAEILLEEHYKSAKTRLLTDNNCSCTTND